MAKQRKDMTDEELARYYQERRGDESLWSQTPAPVTIRKEGGTLFSLRLPAEELEMLRQEAEKRATTVSALLRDGARLLIQSQSPGLERAVSEKGFTFPLSADLFKRVVASQRVIEAILEEKLRIQDCLNLLIDLGLERVLTEIIGPQDKDILLKAILQYALRAPEVVYGHTAEMLTVGDEVTVEPPADASTLEAGAPNVIGYSQFKEKLEERAEALRAQRVSSS